MTEEEIIKELRRVRRAKEWSQDSVAVSLETTRQTIGEYETRSHSPKIDFVSSWADSLGLELMLQLKRRK